MSCVIAKFIPRLLTEDGKDCRFQIAQDNLKFIINCPEMFKMVITGEEWWVFAHDPQTPTPESKQR